MSRERRPLTDDEVQALIQRNRWGVLSLAIDNEPYALAIAYRRDQEAFAFTPGPAVPMLQRNPRACLVITEVEDYGKRWRSVVVQGRVELSDAAARLIPTEITGRTAGN